MARGAQVSFEVADALTAEIATSSYDVVYSRDTILHVKNKLALFKRCAQDLTLHLHRDVGF